MRLSSCSKCARAASSVGACAGGVRIMCMWCASIRKIALMWKARGRGSGGRAGPFVQQPSSTRNAASRTERPLTLHGPGLHQYKDHAAVVLNGKVLGRLDGPGGVGDGQEARDARNASDQGEGGPQLAKVVPAHAQDGEARHRAVVLDCVCDVWRVCGVGEGGGKRP
jgi:hypothetical protein